jgi:isopenicillin-N epimerase
MTDTPTTEFDWDRWRGEWTLQPGVTYLNHGSFGPSPDCVRRARVELLDALESQPMDFLVRRLEPLLDDAAEKLGAFVGCRGDDLIFVPNATTGMNIVADSIELNSGDEVLLTDHEYGAVVRIWGRKCGRAGARSVTAPLPLPLDSTGALVDALFEKVTDRTRLIVVSHVTSQTAAIFPIADICRRARAAGIPVCVDGPHAIAMTPLKLSEFGCDFYTASCHKWLSAPFGSGFLYVSPRWRGKLDPTVTSWGKSLSGRPGSWRDEFYWPGTYDPTAYLAVPAAIAFLERVGLETFRSQTHALAEYARHAVSEFSGADSFVPDDPTWYGSMITVPIPRVARSDAWPGKPHPLQVALWERFQIETPVFEWKQRLCLRVSCHLYNSPADVDHLLDALPQLTP